MRYIVSYDLDSPGKNYQVLYNELTNLAGKRVLLSQWVLNRTGTTAANLRDHIKRFIDSNDRLLVTELDGSSWASYNIMVDLNTV